VNGHLNFGIFGFTGWRPVPVDKAVPEKNLPKFGGCPRDLGVFLQILNSGTS
jgi:hypothetical protein